MKIRILFLLLISSLLAGCMAAVVVGAAGMVVYDKRSITTMEEDTRLYYLINKAIASKPQFKYSRISVTSFNQVVLLVGETPHASTKVMAEKIARDVPKVKRVYNAIMIRNPNSISQQGKDSWITSQVRTQMLTRKGLESGSIRITTENANVYLMGKVTKEQANIATDVARHTHGVQKVIKIFQYIR